MRRCHWFASVHATIECASVHFRGMSCLPDHPPGVTHANIAHVLFCSSATPLVVVLGNFQKAVVSTRKGVAAFEHAPSVILWAMFGIKALASFVSSCSLQTHAAINRTEQNLKTAPRRSFHQRVRLSFYRHLF